MKALVHNLVKKYQNSRFVFEVNRGRVKLSIPSRNLATNILAERFFKSKSFK